MWSAFQTRLTTRGVSGFSMSGLKIPRRVELQWQQITRVDRTGFGVKVDGQDAMIQISFAACRKRDDVLAFMKANHPASRLECCRQ